MVFFGVRGGWIAVDEEYPLKAALGLAAAFGFLLRVGVLCYVVVGKDPRTPFSAALGLAAALGLVLFSVLASWIAVVGEAPRTPLLRCARPGNCEWLGFLLCEVFGRILLIVLRANRQKPLLFPMAENAVFDILGVLSTVPRGCAVLLWPGETPNPLLRCTRPGRCARLGLIQCFCELDCRSRGSPPNPPSSLRSAWPLRSAWSYSVFLRVGLP
jgi:hypothetical protein